MKKEENQKINLIKELKNLQDQQRSRSHSPKAYIGCNTCKQKNNELKKVKSISKLSDYNPNLDKNKQNKFKKYQPEKDQEKEKIKLTDLCDEDKKRIVELIEELSRFADKNKKLKDSLDRVQKSRHEQQDYIMRQAKLHLEEKNFYVSEINDYKLKLDSLQCEIKNKISQWEKHEKVMENEVAYFAKALKESLKEKNDLTEQMNHFRICLRQSLEAFQRLREEITELQSKGNFMKKLKSVKCQTALKSPTLKKKYKSSEDETDEEFFSTCNQNTIDAKSSLDVINDKLEHVYLLLKRKSENISKQNSTKKIEVDFSSLLKKEKINDGDTNSINVCPDNIQKDESKSDFDKIKYMLYKPFDFCSKTSLQAERILKKIEKPLNLVIGEKINEKGRNFEERTRSDGLELFGKNIFQKNLVQQNNLFKTTKEQHGDEDSLLEDLFYSDQNLKLDLESEFEDKDRKS